MSRLIVALTICICWVSAAQSVVGDSPPLSNPGTQPEVMIVGSRHNFCTGVAIAPDLVLTAAHCVLPGAIYKRVEYDERHDPVFRDTLSVITHPQFSIKTLLAHRATADIALIKLARPVTAAPVPLAAPRGPIIPGEKFVLHGYGLASAGEDESVGTLRGATLVATGQPGLLQLRLVDAMTRGDRPGLGACTGDSGSPIYQNNGGILAVVGVVSWSTGARNEGGCGGLTGVTPLESYRAWIIETARKLGSPLTP